MPVNFFQNNKQNTPDGTELVLNNRQLSLIIAGSIILCFFIFITGYFLGQKNVLERFSNKAEQDSLS